MYISSAADHGFETPSGQTKGYTIDMCWFSTKHAALKSKSKDLLIRNRKNVSEWRNMFIRGLLILGETKPKGPAHGHQNMCMLLLFFFLFLLYC